MTKQERVKKKLAGNSLRPSKYVNTSRVPSSGAQLRRHRKTTAYRKKSSNILANVIILLILAGGGYYGYKKIYLKNQNNQAFAGKDSLKLETSPSNVTITVNGQPLRNGNYMESPHFIEPTQEKNSIKIERDGYISKTFIFKKGSAKNNLRLSLKADSRTKHASLEIKSAGKNIDFSINNGFLEGKSPALLRAIPANKTHIISGTTSSNKPFKCSFKVGLGVLTQLIINENSRNICKLVKKSNKTSH